LSSLASKPFLIISSILEDIGLSGAEIKVYTSVLEIGTTSAGKILDRSGLQNSVVHRALNSLIEKGLINFIFEGKKKIYNATDPNNFFNFIDDKKKMFEQILPELKQMQELSKITNKATLYSGKRGITEVYNILINSGGDEYNTHGGGKRVTYDVMGESWWKNLHLKRIENKIPSRQVFDETLREFGSELNKKKITQVKFLPIYYEQLTETVIIKNYVAISIFTINPYAILIEDPEAAFGFRKNFNILWKKASK